MPATEYKTKQQQKKFYRSGAWVAVRREVLRRDNFECQECKRQGRVYTDKHDPDKHKRLDVDHIKELEDYPELALDFENLETLCVRCHNKKHNRFMFQKKKPKWDDEWW
ncbi:HNH endonuclease [Paraliobacillus sp. X-1268]|uniref:HNH endonuclease n=1 Tax=Paraliobacillus sp. X-1268 TaxID=2213193 RepID=UPI000E3D7C13|nr:HNH endonuclease signature motif containing protein [Paraliobacillus sp. X-1268]